MMKSFNFLFGLMLAERILKHTDNLSKTLQYSVKSAVEAHSISQLSIAVLQKVRILTFALISYGLLYN